MLSNIAALSVVPCFSACNATLCSLSGLKAKICSGPGAIAQDPVENGHNRIDSHLVLFQFLHVCR